MRNLVQPKSKLDASRLGTANMFRMINIFIILLFVTLFSLMVGCQVKERRPSKYLIPQNYVGWVRIDFNVESAPILPIEDNYYLFKIPLSGHFETSSNIEYGTADDEYFYYSGDKRKKLQIPMIDDSGMIRAGFNGQREKGTMNSNERQPISTFAYFFVGTDEDLQEYGQAKDENSNPKLGDLRKKEN